jgi:mannitol/fructose-specific phosphotransferase system IIA component (Ntr-type)
LRRKLFCIVVTDSALALAFTPRVILRCCLAPYRMPGRFSQLLDPARVNLHVTSTKRTAALHEVARQLTNHPDVVNFDGFYNELLARDRLDTTSLGHGFAVPHARTEHVKEIVLAVGRSDAGISFTEGDTVKILFMLGTPKSRPGDYLQVLSTLCRLLKDPANREAFLTAATPEAFVTVVINAEAKLLGPA